MWTLAPAALDFYPAASQAEKREGPFIFLFWPGQERAAEALARTVESPPALPGLPSDVLAGSRITVWLAPDETVFDSLAPGVPDWSGGIALRDGEGIVLPTFSPRVGALPLPTVLRHEVAHLALDRYLGAAVPRWFHEGYAQLAASSWGARDAWALRTAILLGRLPSLETLALDFGGRRVNAESAYLLSYTAVEYLQRLGGARGFTRLLESWHEVGGLDPALRRTYGLTLGQFERMWRRDVARRFGWLLLLTQTAVYWTILTILLLVLGYWKRRRDRHKLAQLEEAAAARASNERGADDFSELEYTDVVIDENERNE